MSKRPPTKKQRRDQFLWERFHDEADELRQLKSLQGIAIPCCYGAYHLEFPEWELKEDRVIGVSLVENISGTALSETPHAYYI